MIINFEKNISFVIVVGYFSLVNAAFGEKKYEDALAYCLYSKSNSEL